MIGVVKQSVPLDILVNDPGVYGGGDPLELDPDAVDRLSRINVKAPYHATVEPTCRMGEGGRVIVVGWINGDHRGRSLAEARTRMLRLLDRPTDIPVLLPLVEREILYRVLQGPQADLLRQVARSENPACPGLG